MRWLIYMVVGCGLVVAGCSGGADDSRAPLYLTELRAQAALSAEEEEARALLAREVRNICLGHRNALRAANIVDELPAAKVGDIWRFTMRTSLNDQQVTLTASVYSSGLVDGNLLDVISGTTCRR